MRFSSIGVGAQARLLIDHHVRGGIHGDRQVVVEDVYERDDAAREARLEARLAQRLDEKFESLRKKLTAMTVGC